MSLENLCNDHYIIVCFPWFISIGNYFLLNNMVVMMETVVVKTTPRNIPYPLNNRSV